MNDFVEGSDRARPDYERCEFEGNYIIGRRDQAAEGDIFRASRVRAKVDEDWFKREIWEQIARLQAE